MVQLQSKQMEALSSDEINMVGGARLSANEGALLELALAAGAFTIGASGIGLLAIAAAGIAFAISE